MTTWVELSYFVINICPEPGDEVFGCGQGSEASIIFFITHERTESISLMSYLQERCDMKKGFEKYIQKWGKKKILKFSLIWQTSSPVNSIMITSQQVLK